MAAPDTGRETALGPVLQFMRLLWAVDHALQSASKRMAATLGVTGPQRLVIRIVGRFPSIAAGELAEILHVHPSTLTGIVERLRRRGMLRRRRDPHDGRRLLLSLTRKGQSFDVEVRGTIEEAVERVLRENSTPEFGAAEDFVLDLVGALQEVGTAVRKRTKRSVRASR